MKDGVRTPLTTRPSVALEIETITGRWEFLSFSAGLGATATMREGVLVWVPLTDGDKATLETFIADWCVT
ncbi:MAG: hypothetical protein HXX19_13765 [Rhodoferax sp.]|nr:hypothetical protein [Rhodoferax sp.]